MGMDKSTVALDLPVFEAFKTAKIKYMAKEKINKLTQSEFMDKLLEKSGYSKLKIMVS